jgi:hypothetical protein
VNLIQQWSDQLRNDPEFRERLNRDFSDDTPVYDLVRAKSQAASWVSLMDQHEELTDETRERIREQARDFLKRCGWKEGVKNA